MSGIKENFHIGCVVLFVIVLVLFVAYSVPKLRQQESKRQHKLTSAQMERVWEIADSVHHEELMEDHVYVELLEKYEDLKIRMENIQNYVSDAEDALYELEQQGADVSELEDIISSIDSECK